MRIENFGGLRVRLTGGSDGNGGGGGAGNQGPLVVLLHGFGAPGEDLVPFWRVISAPKGTRFAFPEAPLSLDPSGNYDGRAWWMIDMERLQHALATGRYHDISSSVPPGLDTARKAVLTMLAELEAALGVRQDQVVLGGFSQGAMLACDVAFQSDRSLAGLVLMSGMLIAEQQWEAGMSRRRGLRVLQSHGREDPLLSFVLAESLRGRLEASGLVVDWIPFRGGHTVPPAVTDRLGSFLGDVLSQ